MVADWEIHIFLDCCPNGNRSDFKYWMPSRSNSNDIGSFDHHIIFNKSTTSLWRRRVQENIRFGLLHGPSTKWYKLAIQDFQVQKERWKDNQRRWGKVVKLSLNRDKNILRRGSFADVDESYCKIYGYQGRIVLKIGLEECLEHPCSRFS